MAPEVRNHRAEQLAGIGQDLGLEGHGARERPIAQHPLAEAVDRVEGGIVEAVQGRAQLESRAPGVGEARGEKGAQPVVGPAALQEVEHRAEPAPDALAQFGGRGAREGDGEDPADRYVRLHDEAQEDPRQGPGLSRPGAGLDELHPGERDAEGHRLLDAHGSSAAPPAGVSRTWAKRGSSSAWAVLSNPSGRSSRAPP